MEGGGREGEGKGFAGPALFKSRLVLPFGYRLIPVVLKKRPLNGYSSRPSSSCYDCETVGIPPLMSRKTLCILDGGRGGAVDRARRRRGITGVDKGGA